MGARRKARELALQMLFENDVSGTHPFHPLELPRVTECRCVFLPQR